MQFVIDMTPNRSKYIAAQHNPPPQKNTYPRGVPLTGRPRDFYTHVKVIASERLSESYCIVAQAISPRSAVHRNALYNNGFHR